MQLEYVKTNAKDIYRLEFKNCLLMGDVKAFDGALHLRPIPEGQDKLKKNRKSGINVVSAVSEIDMQSLSERFSQDDRTIACAISDLLCFASRRGVTVVWRKDWGKKKKLIVRGKVSEHGPIETPQELSILLDNGLPRLLDDTVNTSSRIYTGLRWFLGWDEGYSEMKFIRLWMIIEMLARARWHGKTGDPRGKRDRVIEFAKDLKLPDDDIIPFDSMWEARNALVHGDIELVEKNMYAWFSDLVEDRRKEWEASERIFMRSRVKPLVYTISSLNSHALFVAGRYLARVLEKIFLALLDTKDSWFFKKAIYNTTWAP